MVFNHRWIFYDISVIHQCDSLGARPGIEERLTYGIGILSKQLKMNFCGSHRMVSIITQCFNFSSLHSEP